MTYKEKYRNLKPNEVIDEAEKDFEVALLVNNGDIPYIDEALSEMEYEKNIICPYCECEYECDDSWGNEDERNFECKKCENEFVAIRHVNVTYSTYEYL